MSLNTALYSWLSSDTAIEALVGTQVLPVDNRTLNLEIATDAEIDDLIFAWKVAKYVKSNAIVVSNGIQAFGIGGGQVNRIWATEQAIERAGKYDKGSAILSILSGAGGAVLHGHPAPRVAQAQAAARRAGY